MVARSSWTVLLVLVAFTATAQADTITHGSTTINMDFVTVGNAGNAADDTGYGAVSYNYRIGKYEVTADQWAAAIAADSSVGNVGDWSGSQPTGGASWHEAAKFCNWLTTGSVNSGYYAIANDEATPNALSHSAYAAVHGVTYFIPTEDEWYKAAYHKNNGVTGGASNYWEYPTGSDSVPVGIRNPQNLPFDAVFDDGCNQGHPNDVYNAGVLSPYGTIGQGGNLWEWNETLIGSSRSALGGNWDDRSNDLAAPYRSGGVNPSLGPVDVGFRVISVPEPGPGDANNDGNVNDLDASILAANWQRTGDATWTQADFNGDGNVNDLDASILAAHWQQHGPLGAAVPEPSVATLLVSVLLSLGVWRRRRTRHGAMAF